MKTPTRSNPKTNRRKETKTSSRTPDPDKGKTKTNPETTPETTATTPRTPKAKTKHPATNNPQGQEGKGQGKDQGSPGNGKPTGGAPRRSSGFGETHLKDLRTACLIVVPLLALWVLQANLALLVILWPARRQPQIVAYRVLSLRDLFRVPIHIYVVLPTVGVGKKKLIDLHFFLAKWVIMVYYDV